MSGVLAALRGLPARAPIGPYVRGGLEQALAPENPAPTSRRKLRAPLGDSGRCADRHADTLRQEFIVVFPEGALGGPRGASRQEIARFIPATVVNRDHRAGVPHGPVTERRGWPRRVLAPEHLPHGSRGRTRGPVRPDRSARSRCDDARGIRPKGLAGLAGASPSSRLSHDRLRRCRAESR